MRDALYPLMALVVVLTALAGAGCSTRLTTLRESRTASVEFVRNGDPYAATTYDYILWRPTMRQLLLGHRLSLTENPAAATHVVTMAVDEMPDGRTQLRMLEVKPVRARARMATAATARPRRDTPLRDRSGESLDLVEANRRLGEEPLPR